MCRTEGKRDREKPNNPRRGKYEYLIFLPLLNRKSPRLGVLQNYAETLLGQQAPAGLKQRLIEALQKLRGIVLKTEGDPPLYRLNPKLPGDFLARIRRGTAEFFGFETWFDLVGIERNFEEILTNCKNSYAHQRTLASLPQASCAGEINSNYIGPRFRLGKARPSPQTMTPPLSGEGVGPGEKAEPDHCQGPGSLSRRTRRLLRRYARRPKAYAEAGLPGAETVNTGLSEAEGYPRKEQTWDKNPASVPYLTSKS